HRRRRLRPGCQGQSTDAPCGNPTGVRGSAGQREPFPSSTPERRSPPRSPRTACRVRATGCPAGELPRGVVGLADVGAGATRGDPAKGSLTVKRKRAGWNVGYLAQLLGLPTP